MSIIDKVSVNSTTYDIKDNITQIGGRNYLKTLANQEVTASSSTWSYDYNKGLYTVTASNAGGGFSQIVNTNLVEDLDALKGKTCTFSIFDMWTDSETIKRQVVYLYFTPTSSGSQSLLVDRHSVTFVMPETVTKVGVILRLDQNTLHAVGDKAYFYNPKLELGDKATDWCPALEDTFYSNGTLYML